MAKEEPGDLKRVLLVLLVAGTGLLIAAGLIGEENTVVAGAGLAGALLSGVAAAGGAWYLWQRGGAAESE